MKKILTSFKYLLVLIFDIIVTGISLLAAPAIFVLIKMSSKWRIKSYYLTFLANLYSDSSVMNETVINEYSEEDKKDLLDLDD